MAFQANVLQVLVASPSDTAAERRRLQEVMAQWNIDHGKTVRVILLPTLWERSSTPEMGERPQAIINRQLVDDSDVLIGLFWTRLGTPTGEAASGTVEEISRFIEAGKPTLLYFSEQPIVPNSVNTDQLDALRKFRVDVEARGLVSTYETVEDLAAQVMSHITRTVREHFHIEVTELGDPQSGRRSRVVARVETERREVSTGSGLSRVRTETDHYLVLSNDGVDTAENVTFTFGPADDESEPPSAIQGAPVSFLLAGQNVRVPLLVHGGTTMMPNIRLCWRDAATGETVELLQTVSVF